MRKWQAVILTVAMIFTVNAVVFGANTELTFYWCCGQQDRADMYEAMAKEFEASTGIKVNPIYPLGSGSYYVKVITAIVGGAGPDVAWLGTGFWRLADSNLLMPLQDVIAKDATLRTIPSQILAVNNWLGNQLGIPYGLNINAVFYNKDMLDTAGLKMPASWTWDEMLNMAGKLTRDTDGDGTKDIWGFGFMNGDPVWWYSYGGNPFNSSGKSLTINNPENVASLSIMADITTRGIVQPVWGQSFDGRNLFMSSKLALTIDGTFSMPTFAPVGFNWNIGSFPALRFNDKKIQLDVMTPESYSVSAQTKYPDAAVAFLKFLTNKESMLKYAKMGTILPTVSSAFPTFVTGDSKINRKVFVDAIPNLRNYIYSHPTWSSSLSAIQNIYRDQAFSGQIAPAAALEQIEAEGNVAIADFWKNHQ